MARTAVVAGTATAVSNRVSRRQAARWSDQEYAQQAASAPPPQQQVYAPPPAPAPEPAAGGGDDLTTELRRLAELKDQGILSEEEFTAAKAKLLGM
jgi:hypothetical protein